MDYGYVRVSTSTQDPKLQIDALLAAGVERERIFIDAGVSGARTSRPSLDQMLATVTAGDTVTAYKLDRLGRSMVGVIELVHNLAAAGVAVRTLDGATYDPMTSTGRLLLGVLASVAEFERSIIVERSAAGMAAAKARGIHCGRRRAMSDDDIHDAAKESVVHTQAYLAKKYRVSQRTLKRHLDAYIVANPEVRREEFAKAVRGIGTMARQIAAT